jgi:hypothetical protein
MKNQIKKWLGVTSLELKNEVLSDKLDRVVDLCALHAEETEQQYNSIESKLRDLEYEIEDRAKSYELDELEYKLEDKVGELDVRDIVHEEQHEMVLQMVKNTVKELEQKNFDYDLVVSKVVSIITTKLNKSKDE